MAAEEGDELRHHDAQARRDEGIALRLVESGLSLVPRLGVGAKKATACKHPKSEECKLAEANLMAVTNRLSDVADFLDAV